MSLLKHETNVPVPVNSHLAVINLIIWVLFDLASDKDSKPKVNTVLTVWEEKVVEAKAGRYTFGEMDALTTEANLRSLLKDKIGGRNARYAFLARAFQHVTPRTPLCLACYNFGLVADGLDFIELAAGRHTCEH